MNSKLCMSLLCVFIACLAWQVQATDGSHAQQPSALLDLEIELLASKLDLLKVKLSLLEEESVLERPAWEAAAPNKDTGSKDYSEVLSNRTSEALASEYHLVSDQNIQVQSRLQQSYQQEAQNLYFEKHKMPDQLVNQLFQVRTSDQIVFHDLVKTSQYKYTDKGKALYQSVIFTLSQSGLIELYTASHGDKMGEVQTDVDVSKVVSIDYNINQTTNVIALLEDNGMVHIYKYEIIDEKAYSKMLKKLNGTSLLKKGETTENYPLSAKNSETYKNPLALIRPAQKLDICDYLVKTNKTKIEIPADCFVEDISQRQLKYKEIRFQVQRNNIFLVLLDEDGYFTNLYMRKQEVKTRFKPTTQNINFLVPQDQSSQSQVMLAHDHSISFVNIGESKLSQMYCETGQLIKIKQVLMDPTHQSLIYAVTDQHKIIIFDANFKQGRQDISSCKIGAQLQLPLEFLGHQEYSIVSIKGALIVQNYKGDVMKVLAKQYKDILGNPTVFYQLTSDTLDHSSEENKEPLRTSGLRTMKQDAKSFEKTGTNQLKENAKFTDILLCKQESDVLSISALNANWIDHTRVSDQVIKELSGEDAESGFRWPEMSLFSMMVIFVVVTMCLQNYNNSGRIPEYSKSSSKRQGSWRNQNQSANPFEPKMNKKEFVQSKRRGKRF